MILAIINSNDSWSSKPLINISGITMLVQPNNTKWASQTPIYNSPVCHTHTCQHVTVCINCYNACQQSNRCDCTVGKVKKTLADSVAIYGRGRKLYRPPRSVENCIGGTCRHIWDNNIKVNVRQILLFKLICFGSLTV